MALTFDTISIKNNYLTFSISKTINQNDENTDSKLILAPYLPVPKIDFGQAKINESIERNISIVNPQKFEVVLSIYMSFNKSDKLAQLKLNAGSNTNFNIKWQPDKPDKYSYTIIFEVINQARLKFSVNAVGLCIPDSAAKPLKRMLRPLNPNEIGKHIHNQKAISNVTRVLTSKKEKENVATAILISSKQQQNKPSINKHVAPSSSNNLPVAPAVISRQRSVSRDGPRYTAERARIRSEKNALNQIDVPKPIYTNYLKRNSNKTSSNYKSVNANKNSSFASNKDNNQKAKPFHDDNNNKITANCTYNKPNVSTPQSSECKKNCSHNSNCDSCDNKWLKEEEDIYNQEADGLITSTQKTLGTTSKFFVRSRRTLLAQKNFIDYPLVTPMLEHQKSDHIQSLTAKSTSSFNDLLSPIKLEKNLKVPETVEFNENSEGSVYYHEMLYSPRVGLNSSGYDRTFIKYAALENFI
jgi:hypothetical protein